MFWKRKKQHEETAVSVDKCEVAVAHRAEDDPPVVSKPQLVDQCNEVNPPHYALYEFDSEIYAVGPFVNRQAARLWLAGLKHGIDDCVDYTIIGICSDLCGFDNINYIEPKLGGAK